MYLIPKNVKTRFEFFTGFGWKELLITFIGLTIGTIFFFLLGLFTQSLLRLLFVVVGGIAGFMVCKADPRTGQSLLSLVSNFRNFKSKNQTYYYVFGSGRKE